MYFDSIIDEVAKKYSYSQDLVLALKRCVPEMARGKSKPEIDALIETLRRVKIFEFEEPPTQEQLDQIERELIGNRNKHVKFVENNLGGEYAKRYCSRSILQYSNFKFRRENRKSK